MEPTQASSNYGRRLLPLLIDERARQRHSRLFASIKLSNDIASGYVDISYRGFANAINRLAQWLVDNIRPPKSRDEPLVYVAPSDLRYQILCIAAVKAGYITFLPPPRNSDEAFASLLEEFKSSILITDEHPQPCVSTILKCGDMRVFTIPSLSWLLNRSKVAHVPFPGTWRRFRWRPFVQIHSSGSTGLPKLVTLKHGTFSAWDAYQNFEPNELAMRLGNVRMCVSFPPFHMAGLICGLEAPCWLDSTVILPPAGPLTASTINSMHMEARAEYSLLTPSLVVDLAKNREWLRNLSMLRGLTFAGGPLPEATGSLIAQQTILSCGYGAAEAMAVPLLPKSREDWAFFRFNEKDGAIEFCELDAGLYELVIKRRPDLAIAQPVFVTYPDLEEYRSFAPHPLKKGLWRFVSRMDDIIVFSNGEKLNPIACENLISTSPAVKGCVVVGSGQFQPGLLVEPQKSDIHSDELMSQIWPLVQHANQLNPKHGRIAKHLIFLTTPTKPLPRAGKGTIQRAMANALYSNEILSLYDALPNDVPVAVRGKVAISFSDSQSTKASLSRLVGAELGLSHVNESADFFALGMDSLQLMNIVRAINVARVPAEPIDPKAVYDNPTVKDLSRIVPVNMKKEAPVFSTEESDDEELHESWLVMDTIYKDAIDNLGGPKKTGRRYIHRPDNDGPIIPPDGGLVAWTQVLAMFLVNLNNWSLVNSFGVFESFYQTELLPYYSASAISWIGTLQGALLLIIGVISGPLFDEGFFIHTQFIASVGLVCALMLLSISTRYYSVILTQGVLLGICQGLLYIPSVALIPVYFKHRRGLALGLSTGGGPIGCVVFSAILSRLLPAVGFGWAVRIIGFICSAALLTAIILSKPLGPRTSRQLIDKDAFAEPSYIVFMTSAFFLFTVMFVPYFLAPQYSRQTLHASSTISLALPSILNAGQFGDRVFFSWLSDFKLGAVGSELYMIVAELCLGFLALYWISVDNLGGFIVLLFVYGVTSGLPLTLPALVLPHICPNMAVYGTRLGMLYACAGFGFLISSPIAGALNSRTGTFLGSQIWTGLTCLAAATLFAFVALKARRQRMLYDTGKRKKNRMQGYGVLVA